MRKVLLAAGTLLVLSASVASATGVNLSWNDCGLAGTQNTTFACNVTSGVPFIMFASYIPPPNINELVGMSSQIDIKTDQAVLPDWWAHGTGFCRGTTGMSVSFDFTSGPFSCTDFWAGQAAGGFAYDVGFGSPDRARMRIQCAIPFGTQAPVDPSTEYYAYKVTITRAKATGTGSCAGCSNPACIVLNEIQLFQPPTDANDPIINNPIDRQFVTWQGPTSVNICPQSTPNRKSSWGEVKSLYR